MQKRKEIGKSTAGKAQQQHQQEHPTCPNNNTQLRPHSHTAQKHQRQNEKKNRCVPFSPKFSTLATFMFSTDFDCLIIALMRRYFPCLRQR